MFMKTSLKNLRTRFAGFTLIELLVVIAIIAILAAMLLPTIGAIKVKVLKSRAKTEMQQIGAALLTYETTYSRLPLIPNVPTGTEDVTFGLGAATNAPLPPETRIVETNSGIIAILMDEVKFKNGNDTANINHVLNPQRIPMLNPKITTESGGAGVGMDGEYRDPWGNPYVISIDYSFNDRCRDVVHSRAMVSRSGTGQEGFYGLFNPNTTASGSTDNFEFNGKYLIWSKGPDGKSSNTLKADKDVNRDNVLGWTQ